MTAISRTGLGAILLWMCASAAFSQTTIVLREGSDGYAHVGALIRGDGTYTGVNAGVRDQLIVGKTIAGLRAVFSFGLPSIPSNATVTGATLELWTQSTNSLGTVGALELHALTGAPVEGTGDGSGSGAGTGVTWLSRDGQTGAGHAWGTAGGDFDATVLTTVPGYNAALPNAQKTFASTAAFVAAVQAAVRQGQPLNLLVLSPTTEAGANNTYSRISSDDHSAVAERPRLTVSYDATGRPPIVVLPLGDSITQGAGAAGGYRGSLHTLLAEAGFQVAFVGSHAINPSSNLTAAGNTSHEGHGGYTTTDLLRNLDGNVAGPSANNGGHWLDGIVGTRGPLFPDVILLMAGTNDLGVNQLPPAQALAGLEALLAKLVALRPGALIVVATLIPYIGTVYPLREAHQLEFNAALPALVAAHQAAGHHIALYDMRTKVNMSNAAASLTADGVHPNQTGYDAIATGWFEAFVALPLIENWRRDHFGSPSAAGRAADAADWDEDGQPNLVEYVVGSDPTAAAGGPHIRPALVSDLGTDYPGLSFPRRRDAGVNCIVQVSSNLLEWVSDAVEAGPPLSLDATFEQVTFRDRVPADGVPLRFMRLVVVTP